MGQVLEKVNVCICLSVQAESALDQMDWIEKITGVNASLLSSQAPERVILSIYYCISLILIHNDC